LQPVTYHGTEVTTGKPNTTKADMHQ